jgi:phosphonate transport system substrate-binding protein
MLNRRLLLATAGAAALPAALAAPARAQAMPSELVIAVVPSENSSGVVDRLTPLANYLTKQTGVKTTLRVASDYAAVIEGQKAGNIHIGGYGPGSYVRAHQQSNGNVVAFTTTRSKAGAVGYYSVGYVRADSPFKTIQDLKGKKLGLVDPNSTSGNFAPRYFLDKQGINPDTFFSNVSFTGSHENAVIALLNGTVDIAMNWWNADGDSNFDRMVNKGMAKKSDVRIAWKSDLLAGSPYAYLANLPPALKTKIEDAFYNMHVNDKAMMDKMEDGQTEAYVKVSHDDYIDTANMLKFIDALRRKSS